MPAAETGAIRAAHCRVNGVIGKEIRFSLLLPDAWNRKFMMGGGGGFVGSIDNQARASVNAGYATVGTDTGHQGGVTDASWALNNPSASSISATSPCTAPPKSSKAILRSYYGSNETRVVLLRLLERRPPGADGSAALSRRLRRHRRRRAGATTSPASARSSSRTSRPRFPDPRNLSTPMFTPETLKSVEAQIVEKCDAVDGVKDGADGRSAAVQGRRRDADRPH